MPVKTIARTLGISKNTVKSALKAAGPPKYERKPAGSAVDAFDPAIREQLRAFPTMPATVIAERVGWSRGITVLRDRVRELRPAYLPPDPASRTLYEPGELAQFDFWFPPVTVPVGHGQHRAPSRLPVMTTVSGYSRASAGVLIPSRGSEDLYAGWWALLNQLGGVPKALVWDGEGAVGRWRARKPELTADCQAFRGMLGAKVVICKPADPEAKGMLERLHDYLERSFLPGRSFASPADFNAQLSGFFIKANNRRMRVLGCAPNDRVAADRAAMLGLPPVAPQTGWRRSLRLPRDHYVRLDSNDYSVHPAAVGRRIGVHADLDRVRVFCDGAAVADHARTWAQHQTITDPAHSAAAAAMRRGRAELLRPVPDARPDHVEVRPLGVYDRVLGLDEEAI